MRRTTRIVTMLTAVLLQGCLSPLIDVSDSESENGDGGESRDGGDSVSGTRGDGDEPIPVPELGPCADYIECAREATPEAAADILETYGERGTCWERPNVEPQDCWMQCSAELERMGQAHPHVASCCPAGDCVDAPAFTVIEEMLRARCIDGCHEPGGLWFTFDMSVDTHARIVGVTGPSQGQQCNLVEPGSPDLSYIWHKLNGTQQQNCNGAGAQMPVDPSNVGQPTPLSQHEIDLFTSWVLAGAPP
jgi:hypothetical protein